VTPTAAGTLNNTASVAGNETDPIPGNDTSPPLETTVDPVPSGGPFDGNAFSSGGGSMAATTYQLVPGVVGQSVTGTGLLSTNYQIEAGFAPGVTGGGVVHLSQPSSQILIRGVSHALRRRPNEKHTSGGNRQ
jgi:hypothetical protein